MLNSTVALDCDALNSFYLKYVRPAIFTALKLLFNIVVEFGVESHSCGVCVVTPVVKK